MNWFRSARSTAVALLSVALAACGGETGSAERGAAPQDVAVAVEPPEATVEPLGKVAFAATVTGAAVTTVEWTIDPAGCGSVSTAGLYTAPAAAGTCRVVATSSADPTKSAAATVTVEAPPPPPPPVAVAVSPASTTALACRTVSFTATVTGATNPAVTWTVLEGAAGGTITSAGLYTAPTDAGIYHVVATSVEDGSKSATATVTVSESVISVAVSPSTIALEPGESTQLTATVTTTCGTFTALQTVVAPN